MPQGLPGESGVRPSSHNSETAPHLCSTKGVLLLSRILSRTEKSSSPNNLKISALRDKRPCQVKCPTHVYPGDIQGPGCGKFWHGRDRRLKISDVLSQVQCQGYPDCSWPQFLALQPNSECVLTRGLLGAVLPLGMCPPNFSTWNRNRNNILVPAV